MSTRVKRNRRCMEKSQERYRGHGPRGISKTVTREVLENHFHMPLDEASKALQVSTTIVKRLCRKMGITRWPYRQISSIDKNIKKLEQDIDTTTSQSEAARLQGEVQSLRYKREDIIRNPKPLAPHGLCIRKRSSIERSISAAVGLLESEPETRSDDGDVPTEKADDEGDGTADDHGDSVEDVPDNSVGGSDIEDSDVEDSCVDDSEENSSEVDDDDGRMARAPIAVGGYFGYGYSMRKSSGPLRPPGVQLREYKSRKNHRFSGGQTEDSSDGSTTNFAQASTAPLRRRKIPVAATALLLSTVGTASVPPSSVLKTRLLTRPRVRKLDTGGYLQRTKYFCCKKLGCVPGSATRNEPFTLTANCKESSRFPEAVVGLSIFETNGMNIGIADGVECPVGSSGPRQDSGRFMESQTPSKEAKFMMNEYDTYIGGCQGSSAEIPKFNKRSDYRASDEMPNIVALKDLACT